MVRSLSKRGMPKPFAILIVALLALYFVPLNALPASAVTVGGFEIEGNLADDATPGIDWATVDTTSASFSTAVDHTTGGQDDTVFGGGSKEYNDGGQNGWPGWDFGGGNAPGKSDFGRWATYTNSDANNHLWLFLGFDRDAAQGTAKYAFELNQVMQADPNNANPTRSQGDLKFIIWDQGNGALTLTGDAMNTDVGLYRWIDPDQQAAGVAVDTDKDGHWVKVGANGTFVGAINTAAVTVPSWWTSGNVTQGSIGADQFGEFGVDLTSFGAVLGCPSQGFTAANARSITGTGTTGALVDYLSALGVHIPSTCTSLVTHATNQVVVGNSISDTATITPSNATGTVTFKVYGPDDATCANAPVATLGPINVAADGTASSGNYTPATVGTYRWIASYDSNDDAHFADSVGKCNDTNEQSVVVKASPKITTTAGSSGTLPGAVTVSDVAHLTGLTETAGGKVTFTVYGPFGLNSSPTCTGTSQSVDVSLGSVGADHAIDVSSGPLTVTHAGKYYWIASYNGDTNNEAVAGQCGDANETSTVEKTTPTITTDADATASLPDDATVSDTATLSGVTANAGGSIVFKLFGPDSGTPTCTEGVGGNLEFTSEAFPVNGSGTYGPATHPVTKAGTYYWVAYYSGDGDNNAVAGVCGETKETSNVDKASPKITTTASTTGNFPGVVTIADTAHLTGLTADATGKVTFNVYGPFASDSQPTCSGNPFKTIEVTLGSVGADHAIDVPSGDVTVTAAGKYYWVASYNGDDNNNKATGACGDTNETSEIGKTSPKITTTASTDGKLPGSVTISDVAHLTGLTETATGKVTFRVYGPFGLNSDPTCTGTAFKTVEVTLGSVGADHAIDVPSGAVSVTVAGKYYWVASYNGDSENSAVSGVCGDTNETSTVEKASPAITTTAGSTGTLPGAVTVSDVAHLTGLTETATGKVTFTVYGPFGLNSSPTCTGTSQSVEVSLGSVGADHAIDVPSGPVSVTVAGKYYWVASYGGDGSNSAVAGQCGDANETSTVEKASPAITTTAGSTGRCRVR
jgi:hypothetical protein